MENYDPFMDEIDCALVNEHDVYFDESDIDEVDLNSNIETDMNESTFIDDDVRLMFESEQDINFDPCDDDILGESFNIGFDFD